MVAAGGGGAGYYGGSGGPEGLQPGAGGSSFISGYAGDNLSNGKAKITYLGNTIEKKNDKLNNVRYIKDCVNGQSKGEYNHWIEIQAIYNGQNVSKGKNIAGTSNGIRISAYD